MNSVAWGMVYIQLIRPEVPKVASQVLPRSSRRRSQSASIPPLSASPLAHACIRLWSVVRVHIYYAASLSIQHDCQKLLLVDGPILI